MRVSEQLSGVLVHHSVAGNLHIGDFVCISSGNPSNPYIGRIAGKNGEQEEDMLQIQWCWRPFELLDYMRKSGQRIPDGRTEKSFAQNELVLGTRCETVALNSVISKTDVFLISDIIAEGKSVFESWFFYRQVVNEEGEQWRLEPPLPLTVVDLSSTNQQERIVENPGKILRFCSARLSFACDPNLLYDTGEDDGYKEVWEPHEPFTCPACREDEEGITGGHKEKRMLGTEWLGSVDLASIEAPSDESKRMAIIEKFYSAIEETGYEETDPDKVILSRGDIMRLFCVDLERNIFESTAGKPREYKSKVYTISFNISDKKNTSIRRRIIEGEFSPESLANADSETLASEEVQVSRQEQRDKYFTTQVLKAREDEGAELKKQRIAMGEDIVIQQDTFLQPSIEVTEDKDTPMGVLHDSAVDEEMEKPVFEEPNEPDVKDMNAAVPVPNVLHDKLADAREKLRIKADEIRARLECLGYIEQRKATVSQLDYIMKHV